METRRLRVLLAAVLLSEGVQAQTRGGQGTMKEITDRVLLAYDRNTNPTLAVAQEAPSPSGECPRVDVNMIDAQIYVTKIPAIDQKAGTYSIEGFFRLWWNDPRLTFDDSEAGGCVEKLVFRDGPSKLWTPDFYFPPSVTHQIGAKNDGQLMEVRPNGDVYWSQRLRVTINCAMDFRQMPWDTQECDIVMGSYSQGPAEVNFQWKRDRIAMDKLDEQTNNEWEIGPQEQGEVRIEGLNPKVQVKFTLTRIPGPYIQSMLLSVVFVAVSYFGCWIAKGAVPARVTLAIVTILVVSNTQTALRAQLPKISYSVWLLDFQSGCLIFNLISFILYVLVNFGSQQKAAFVSTPYNRGVCCSCRSCQHIIISYACRIQHGSATRRLESGRVSTVSRRQRRTIASHGEQAAPLAPRVARRLCRWVRRKPFCARSTSFEPGSRSSNSQLQQLTTRM